LILITNIINLPAEDLVHLIWLRCSFVKWIDGHHSVSVVPICMAWLLLVRGACSSRCRSMVHSVVHATSPKVLMQAHSHEDVTPRPFSENGRSQPPGFWYNAPWGAMLQW